MNPYFEQKILTADPMELTRMVYQRAIASVCEAREHLKAGRVAERSQKIDAAYKAVAELMSSLRSEEAPELSARLSGLYGYMQQRLLDANFEQSDKPLVEVLGLMSTLAEAWQQVGAAQAEADEYAAAMPAQQGYGMWHGGMAAEQASRYALSA